MKIEEQSREVSDKAMEKLNAVLSYKTITRALKMETPLTNM